ncbi:unnamed protein product [Gadus morhua 'NCC']
MKAAAPRDPKTHCRLFGYLVAYLSSIYGHRSGVLTRMRVKEVQDAIGDSEKGYLINLMEHKTVRKFGVAQVYLESDEYGWCREWLCLRLPSLPQNSYFFTSFGRGEPKDLIKYFRQAWGEMGLPGSPSLTDIRSAVATYNLETNHSEAVHLLKHNTPTSDAVEKVILSFGINDRNRGNTSLLDDSLRRLYSAAKATFPNALVHIPVINASRDLDNI